jgi:hypothetical protein
MLLLRLLFQLVVALWKMMAVSSMEMAGDLSIQRASAATFLPLHASQPVCHDPAVLALQWRRM